MEQVGDEAAGKEVAGTAPPPMFEFVDVADFAATGIVGITAPIARCDRNAMLESLSGALKAEG